MDASLLPTFPVLNSDAYYPEAVLRDPVTVTMDRVAWLRLARSVRADARRRIAIIEREERPEMVAERLSRLHAAWVDLCTQAEVFPVGGVFDA